jgi:AraC-like DNA-binding protein
MRQSLSKSRQLHHDQPRHDQMRYGQLRNGQLRHGQPHHGQMIGAALVRLLCAYLRKNGHCPQTFFDAPLDADTDIDLARWHELLEIAATKLNEPAIGLAIARQATWRDFGLIGYLALSCATIGEALERSTRYSQLIAQRNKTTFTVENDLVILSWSPQRSRTQQLVDGVGIGTIVASLRMVIGEEFTPTRVDFISSAPADVDVYQQYFACPVYFDQAFSRLCFSRHYLDFPLLSSEPALVALLDEQANTKLQEIAPLNGEMYKLRGQLVQLIRQEKTRLRDLAEINFISARTLQRLLHQQGSSFQELLDETRLRLAKEYLADVRLDLSAVANLVGYSEQSSFTRAFQQWTNFTPGQWRNTYIIKSDH